MNQVSPVNADGLIELVFGLLFVIIVIFTLAWAFKRFGSGGLGMGGVIKVLAAMSLGNRDRIALISVGSQQLLIGISPGRISTLHAFDEPLDLSIENSRHGQIDGASIDFKQELAKKLQTLVAGDKA